MNETFLTFHIGSSFVNAVLVKREKGVSKIILSRKEEILKTKETNIDKLWLETLVSMDLLLRRILKEYHSLPDKIFCILSSLWHVSELRTVEFKNTSSFVFNSKFADELLHNEINNIQNKYSKEEDYFKDKLIPIEMKIMKTSLNGYTTARPFEQKATEIKMDIFISLMNETAQNEIRKVIYSFYPEKNIKFSSFTFSSFVSARDMFPEKDFLLLSIDGESTDVCVIKNGGLVAQNSFQMGSNLLFRITAFSFECSLPEASSIVSLYQDGHANTEITRKMELNIKELEKKWLQKFEESLGGFSEGISIPRTIYFSTEEKVENIFFQLISKEKIHQYVWALSKFQIYRLPREMFHSLSHNQIVC